MHQLNRIGRLISDNRQDFRICIFIFSQIFILSDSKYASIFVGICVILSVIVCLSQIYCERMTDKEMSLKEAIKKSLYSIYFSVIMLVIWLLVISNSTNYVKA